MIYGNQRISDKSIGTYMYLYPRYIFKKLILTSILLYHYHVGVIVKIDSYFPG